jgi:heme exporter protein A
MEWTENSRPGILAAVALAASRGGRRLFAGLGFTLAPGSALLLTGPNGSGKSSLLRLLAGFGRPTSGGFTWDAAPIEAAIEAHRHRLHYVGHHDALKPALTVAETLEFWTAVAGREGALLPAALDAFGLAPLAGLPCRFLSAGQRRRLALARLVAWPAPLWLLDEPTVGLDALALGQLFEACRRHQDSGGSIVLSTHQAVELVRTDTVSLGDFVPAAQAALAW